MTAATGMEDAQQVINTSQHVAQIMYIGSLQQPPRKLKIVIWDWLNLISSSSSFYSSILLQILHKTSLQQEKDLICSVMPQSPKQSQRKKASFLRATLLNIGQVKKTVVGF